MAIPPVGAVMVRDTLICFPDIPEALRVMVPKKVPKAVNAIGVIAFVLLLTVVKLLFNGEKKLVNQSLYGAYFYA